jgi:hypothetical protein
MAKTSPPAAASFSHNSAQMPHFETLEPRLQFNGGDIDSTFGDAGLATVDFAPALPQPWQMLAEDTLGRDDGGRIYALARAVTTDAGPAPPGHRAPLPRRPSRSKFAADGFRILDRDPTNSFEGFIYTATDPPQPHVRRRWDAHLAAHAFGEKSITPSARHGRGKIAVPVLSGGDSPARRSMPPVTCCCRARRRSPAAPS